MLPYRPASLAGGDLFNSVLQEPLTAPTPAPADAPIDTPRFGGVGAQEVGARLLTPISFRDGAKRSAGGSVVTRPVFSSGHAAVDSGRSHALQGRS